MRPTTSPPTRARPSAASRRGKGGVANPFFTIGHSTRTIAEFVALLAESDVTLVVDVRTIRRSRTNPQYNEDVLGAALAPHGIGYEPIAELGGRRGKQRDVPADVNAFWENRSFHNYADHAMSDDFRVGLTQLRELGRTRRLAFMCAEAVWWRCHRRIIADHLLAAGETVFHILGPGHVDPATTLTRGAVVGKDGVVRYPAN